MTARRTSIERFKIPQIQVDEARLRESFSAEILDFRIKNGSATQHAIQDLLARLRSVNKVIVVDHALGLSWELPGGLRPISIDLAAPRAHTLGALRFGGFQNWRLPTIEEVFSLVHMARCDEYRAHFEGLEKRIWTTDSVGIQVLSVDLETGEIKPEGFSQASGLWPRSICVASTTR